MKKRFLISTLVILSAYILATIVYLCKEGYWQSFIQSNIFWTLFMPPFIAGGVLLRGKEDLKIGLFGKLLLAILGLFWLFAIVSLFTK